MQETTDRDRPAPLRAGRGTTLIAIGLAVETLVVLSLLLVGHHDPRDLWLRWLQLGIMSALGVAGWALTIRRPDVIDRRVLAAVGLLLAGTLLSTVASPLPTVAWAAAWNGFVVAGAAFLFCHQAAGRRGRDNLLAALTLLSIVVVVAYLVVVAGLWREWLGLGMPITELPLRPGNVGGILAIPTWFGDAVVVTVPIAAMALARQGRRGVVAAGILLAAAAVALFVTATRSIWLVVPLGAAVILIGSGTRRVRQIVIGAIAIAAVAGVAVALSGAADQIVRDVDAGRSSAFASAIQLFFERPLTGGGAGTFGVWRLDDDVRVLSHRAFPNAHNLALNTLGETGVVGMVLWIVALVMVAFVVRDRWRGRTSDRMVAIAAIASLVMILGHAMVDVVVEHPGLLLLTLMAAAVVFVPAEAAPPRALGGRARLAVVAMVVVGAAILPFALRSELAVYRLAVASALPPGAEAMQASDAAAADAPDFALLQVQLGAAAAGVGDVDASARAAVAAYDVEGTSEHLIAAAWLADRAGDRTTAQDVARRAVTADRLDPFVLLNGAMLLDGGDIESTRGQAIVDLVVAEPAIEVAPPGGPTAQEIAAAAIERLLTDGRWDAALVVALQTDDPEVSASVLAAMPEAEREPYEIVADAWFGGPTERAALYTAATAAPSASMPWLTWFVAAEACDVAEAQRWRRVHVILSGQPPVIPSGPSQSTGPAVWPTGYPQQVWRIRLPRDPYVPGTWTYEQISPDCRSGDG